MQPSGRIGAVFGFVMAQMNDSAYRWAVEQLRPFGPKSLLEIGFGTGHHMARAIRTLKLERAAGVDPSPLMVDAANRRLARFRKNVTLDVRAGDDASLPDGPFDAISALHSFQFWSDPDASLARIRQRLAPDGHLVLVLRTHAGTAPQWLPNPLSRDGNEIAGACAALERAGFAVTGLQGISRNSQGITAMPR
jgi:SAM-dependent methyltransferase